MLSSHTKILKIYDNCTWGLKGLKTYTLLSSMENQFIGKFNSECTKSAKEALQVTRVNSGIFSTRWIDKNSGK